MLLQRFVGLMFSIGIVILGVDRVSCQDYPSKPIRIITGGVGSSNDFATRLIAPRISGPLGQPVVVENRGGGFQTGEAASKAPPDGYTLLFTGGSHWTGPLLRKAPYDPVKDFSPIGIVGIEPNILVVHPSVPAKSVKELIALAKARPGELHYSMGGVGGSAHMTAELFSTMAHIKLVGVGYKSDNQAINELLGGYVQMTFEGGIKMGPFIKLGKLRPLAITTLQPSQLAPDLPTVAASGLPEFEAVGILGMFALAGTPATIISRLNQEIVRVPNTKDVKERFLAAGVEVVASSPEEFASKLRSEMSKFSKLIKDAGIKAE